MSCGNLIISELQLVYCTERIIVYGLRVKTLECRSNINAINCFSHFSFRSHLNDYINTAVIPCFAKHIFISTVFLIPLREDMSRNIKYNIRSCHLILYVKENTTRTKKTKIYIM